jgi:diguanylate cyclase (GGDEF)-like protein/PAS domain S-box-containing protein
MPADRAGNSTSGEPRPGALEESFRRDWALKRFRVEYQPQVNLRSRKIVRFEALLRWEHPAVAISPKDFIPMAERLGMIWEIGEWVLAQACLDALSWPAEIGVAVNVSAMSLTNPALPAMVQKAIADSGIAASRLELEVTETAAIVMNTESFGILKSIQDLGVRITIDDLDVGHASLSYLLYFPFDKVKVDGLYAAALRHGDWRADRAREIMRSVATLCQTLKIDALAEGVETGEQLAQVMEDNFTEVQGFIFGESVRVEKVPDALAHNDDVWKNISMRQPVADTALSFFQVADVANDIILVTNAELEPPGPLITYVNPAFTRLTGFTPEDAIGKSPRILQGPGTSRKALDSIRAALREGRGAHEKLLNYTKTGAPYWLDMRIEPLRNATGIITHFVGIERDVTLDKRRLDELEYVADRDVLTGIPNRRAFLKAIESEIALCREIARSPAERRPLCVAWIDVDRFKEINDSFGHAAGDAVLFRIADRLAENIRRLDAIGRLGGEEFAVCMPALTIEDAYGFADMLRQAVATAASEIVAKPIVTTISIGVAELLPSEDAASLLARADAAMYEAKRAGGNRVYRSSAA